MPTIHPTLLADIASGIPCEPLPTKAVANAVCADGVSYGRVDAVPFLCPQRHVCAGHLNTKWFRLMHEYKSEYRSTFCPKLQLVMELSLIRTWHSLGGSFILRCGRHLAVCDNRKSLYIVRSYLSGLQRLPLLTEISIAAPLDASPTPQSPPSRRTSPRSFAIITPSSTQRKSSQRMQLFPKPKPTIRNRQSPRLSVAVTSLPPKRKQQVRKPPYRHHLGAVVWKLFDDGWFKGKVTRHPGTNNHHYLIIYSDGDQEEMIESQIDYLLRKREEYEQRQYEQHEEEKKKKKKKVVKEKPPPHKKKQQAKNNILAKDIYLEMPWPASPDDVELTSDAIVRLRNAGCGSQAWLSIATRVYNEFLRKKDAVTKKRRKESLNPIVPLYWIKGKKRRAALQLSAIKFHQQVVAPLRRKGSRRKNKMPTSARDMWGNWFPRDQHRAENAGKCMIKTPGVNDDLVERAETWMRKELGVGSCLTVLQPPQRKRRYSYRSLTHLYGMGMGMQYNFKKAGSMVLFSLLCVVLDRAPNTIEEWLAVRGIGLKCGHICMFEGCGEVTGIGVDIHIWRMSTYFGWTSKMNQYNCEKATRELESWFPRKYWGEMNELYAGLGQLLQTKKHKELLQKNLMKRARATNDKEVIRLANILLSIPEYK